MKKNYCEFVYSKGMANFEAFRQTISSSIDLLISEECYICLQKNSFRNIEYTCVLSRKHKTEVNFVLGRQDNMSKMINKEAERHQDILLVNVLDSYMNLTLKSVFMLKYLSDISGLYESLQTALKVNSRLKMEKQYNRQ